MKKILVISRNFPPANNAGVHRLIGFSNHLPRMGYKPYILTTNDIHGIEDQGLLNSLAKDLPIYRTIMPGFAPAWLSDPRRARPLRLIATGLRWLQELLPIDYHFLWIFPATLKARKIIAEEGIDIVLLSSPPHSSQFIGVLLKLGGLKYLVSDFRDAWFHNPEMRKLDKPYRMSRTYEKIVVKSADLIIANTPRNQQLLLDEYGLEKNRVWVLPNGFNENPTGIPPSTIQPGNKFTITYTGELYAGMVEPFFQALATLKNKHSDLAAKLRVIFAGLIYQRDLDLITKYGLKDIIDYRGHLSFDKCVDLVMETDLCLFLLENSPSVDNWVPSKLYFYLGLKKAILAIAPDGDATDVIKKVSAGYAFQPSQLEQLADQLNAFIYSGEPVITEYNESEWVKYSRSHQVEQLALRLNRLTENIESKAPLNIPAS